MLRDWRQGRCMQSMCQLGRAQCYRAGRVACLAFLIAQVSQPQGGARRALASPGSAAASSRASRSAIAFRRGGCFVRAGCTGARRRRRRLQMKNSRGSSGRLTGMHVEERLPGARGWVPARHACFLTMMPAANENASRGTKHASVPSGARPPLTMRRGDRRAMMRTQAQASHPFCPFGSRSCCA